MKVTAGNVSHFTIAPELIDFSNADAIVGDKGYDSEDLRRRASAQGKRPIIPVRKGKRTN